MGKNASARIKNRIKTQFARTVNLWEKAAARERDGFRSGRNDKKNKR